MAEQSLRDVMGGLPPEPALWDAEALERVMRAALREGDVQAVVAALRLMAPLDPGRAQELLDTLQLGLALAGRGVTSS